MPDRMPEDMSDRMPEDLPVRKCINAMVGIIRSEVIFPIQMAIICRNSYLIISNHLHTHDLMDVLMHHHEVGHDTRQYHTIIMWLANS
jgi:hypothetical protein